MRDSKGNLIRKIKYLESLVKQIDDSESQVMHQMTFLMNEIDYMRAMLLQIEVEEYFSEEEW